MTHCCIALGANLGDPAAQFEEALDSLNKRGQHVIRVSSNHVTSAMGEQAGSDFVNAAAVVDTQLSPEQFLLLLHQIEADIGRERTVTWGPRVLDLDLLLYGSQVIESKEVVVPHPSMWYRRFVIQPLNEIASDWVHPVLNQSISKLLEELDRLPIQLKISGVDLRLIRELETQLSRNFLKHVFQLFASHEACDTTFATIEFLTPDSEGIHPKQPRLESDRTIRFPFNDPDLDNLSIAEGVQSIADAVQFLTDVLTAALSPDHCI